MRLESQGVLLLLLSSLMLASELCKHQADHRNLDHCFAPFVRPQRGVIPVNLSSGVTPAPLHRATARVTTPRHTTPALTKIRHCQFFLRCTGRRQGRREFKEKSSTLLIADMGKSALVLWCEGQALSA
jgi:hypothetical protein